MLVTLFVAFLIGGYASGRMANRQGIRHGLLVALLALIVTLILAFLDGVAGPGLVNNLQDVTLPGVPAEIVQQGLGTVLTLGGSSPCSSRSWAAPSAAPGARAPAATDPN